MHESDFRIDGSFSTSAETQPDGVKEAVDLCIKQILQSKHDVKALEEPSCSDDVPRLDLKSSDLSSLKLSEQAKSVKTAKSARARLSSLYNLTSSDIARFSTASSSTQLSAERTTVNPFLE